jgi:hypothetical protein
MSQILQGVRHRFMTNLRNPVMRHNVAVLMAGKILGLGIIMALMVTFIPSFAHAQGAGPDATAQINAINTVWTLVAAFLVFCMQAGFVMLEAGFARQRESSTFWLKDGRRMMPSIVFQLPSQSTDRFYETLHLVRLLRRLRLSCAEAPATPPARNTPADERVANARRRARH